MEWVAWSLIVAVIVGFILLKKLTVVGEAQAREHVRNGAKVIDVRSEREFKNGHLPGALNVPLDRLGEDISRVAPNKTDVLLLHCLSGGRSAIGVRTLKKAGYANVHNLGSYSRAQKLVQ